MGLTIVMLASAGLWTQGLAPADLVLTGGRIDTLDAARPWVEAVAIRGSRIVAVGSDADVRPMAGSGTGTIDLRGAFVTPGSDDAPVHIDSTGSLLVGLNLLEIHEADAFTDAVAAPRHPVLVQRVDRSLFLANSLALQAAGIRAASPDPQGGEIVRDAKGEQAGWFPDQRLTIEEAIEAYTKGPAPASFEQDVKGTIVPGCGADLAVFDTDLVEAGRTALARLLQAKVLYTVAGGRVVYQR